MRSCCVIGCKSAANRSRFKIPRDPKRRLQWLKALPNPPRTEWCCDRHFEPNSFINDGNDTTAALSTKGARKTKGLTPDAVPTIFATNKSKETGGLKRSAATTKNETDVLIDNIGTFDNLQRNIHCRLNLKTFQVQIQTSEIYLFDLNVTESKRLTVRTSVVISKSFNAVVHFNGLQQSGNELAAIFGNNFKVTLYSQLQQLIDKYSDTSMKSPYLQLLTEYDHEASMASLSDRRVEMSRHNSIASLKELRRALTISQMFRIELDFIIDQLCLIRPISHFKQHMFPIQTIIHAYLIYCQMTDGYDTIRNQFILTLPLPSTMQLLTSLSDTQQLSPNSIQSTYLRSGIAKMLPIEKLVNIQIKEIYYNGRLAVQASNANCYATSILCFVMNSIFGKMKKIVYLLPVNDITAPILHNVTCSVVDRVHKLDLQVITITAEQSLTGKKLFQQLMQATTDDALDMYRYPNPVYANEYIYLLYNPASVLRTVRNDWIDQNDPKKMLNYPTFDTGAAKSAAFTHLYELYESESDMLVKTAPKIDRETVYPNSNERELITLVLNVFDGSTATALRTASDGYHATVDLLDLLNMWWTIMDIRTKTVAIVDVNDDNLDRLRRLSEWMVKWKLMAESGGGRLNDDTYEALIQTSNVILSLARYTFVERKFLTDFLPGKFHTDTFEMLFTKYRKYKKY